MSYQIKLTDKEMETLGWITDRGYFPIETYDAMYIEDEKEAEHYDEDNSYDRKHTEWTWTIPEHAAWAISNHREEDPHSLYACCGGSLLDKLIKLEESIV